MRDTSENKKFQSHTNSSREQNRKGMFPKYVSQIILASQYNLIITKLNKDIMRNKKYKWISVMNINGNILKKILIKSAYIENPSLFQKY